MRRRRQASQRECERDIIIMKSSSFSLIACLFVGVAYGWVGKEPPIRTTIPQNAEHVSRRRSVVVTSVSTAILFHILTGEPNNSFAAVLNAPVSSVSATSFQEQLTKSLSEPTEDRPQIPFPVSSSNLNQNNIGVVQGLVYLQNPNQERPLATDILTLKLFPVEGTATTDQPIAGAKIPISRVRFPMNFRLTKDNVIPGQEERWDKTRDFLVKATICRPQEDGSSAFCGWDGEGVSKFIQLPQGEESGARSPKLPAGIRAAASISLAKPQ